MTDPRAQLVADGYDAMIDTWESWKERIVGDPRAEWLDALVARLPAGAQVVELGCGGGTAESAALAGRFQLTGVDLSSEQIRRARERIPEAEFIQADFTTVEFPAGSVDAIVAFYAFNHVPRKLLGDLLARIHSWLARGGIFMASLGAGDTPDWTGEWLGVPMFFSGWPPDENRCLLELAGFTIERDELVAIDEPEGKATFQWVLARQ